MKILKNHSLQDLNAFHIDVEAKYIAFVNSENDLLKLLGDVNFKDLNKYVVGEGSGTLFSKDYNGLVIKLGIKDVSIVNENGNNVLVKVGAGVIWDDFVEWAIEHKLQGVENVSGVPGTVGAAPVQNIAAYGQEFAGVFDRLEAVEIETGNLKTFNKNDLKFKYRDSVFKNELKGKYIITEVFIKLNKNFKLNTTYHSRYESVNEELKNIAKKPYTLKDIRNAVLRIRDRKFPDWKVQGNTGSFFKNPFISKEKLEEIQKIYPDVQFYPIDRMQYPDLGDKKLKQAKTVKLAAAWLLEELGWKGKRIDNVGTSPNQAFVIINYGGATAKDILDFSKKMSDDFNNNFGITLEPEVRII